MTLLLSEASRFLTSSLAHNVLHISFTLYAFEPLMNMGSLSLVCRILIYTYAIKFTYFLLLIYFMWI